MKILVALILMIGSACANAQTVQQYTRADSLKVMKLITDGRKQPTDKNLVIYLARKLKGIPYVAKTLEKNKRERLVVNLRQLDCTTYVENVLALYLCCKSGKREFADFCEYLRQIRYEGGKVSYAKRLHYFSLWIEDNTSKGLVQEKQSPNPPFTHLQKLDINYMSKNHAKYPMLASNPALVKDIAAMEKKLSGKTYRYIPKDSIANSTLLRETIHYGDILAIVTNKGGLDTSHIGIAVWHKNGLHLLNASMIHKKVVEESMTLYEYMRKHPSQIGIRVICIK